MTTNGEDLFIKRILFILSFSGCNPLQERKLISAIGRTVYIFCNTIFFVLVILYIYFNGKNMNIDGVSKIMEATITSIHAAIKAYIFLKYKKNFIELLTATYWKMKDVDEELQKKNDKMFAFLRTVSVTFLICAVICVVIFCYIGLYFRKLMFLCYVPNKYFLTTESISFIQLSYLLMGGIIALSFDSIFMYLCYKHSTQYQIISYKLENISKFNDVHLEINKCIEHHGYMLRLFKKLNETYGIFFLCQYIVSLITYTTNLYQVSEDSSNVTQLIKSLFYAITTLLQFVGCNCYFADFLAENMTHVRVAAYNANWYDGDLKLARKILVILANTQKENYIQAGGLADINLAVLTNLFKTTFSFIAFLRTLEGK